MPHRRENPFKTVSGRVKKSRRERCSRSPLSSSSEEKEGQKEKKGVREKGGEAVCFLEERALACEICLDLLHNAMSVSPCNHKFCAGCIYEWNDTNRTCPKCRWHVLDISRDPFVNSIVEQYVAAYPEKARSESCRIALDERELMHLEKYRERRQAWDRESEWSHRATQDDDESMDDGWETDEEEEASGEGGGGGGASWRDGSAGEVVLWSDSDTDDGAHDNDDEAARRAIEDSRISRLRAEKKARARARRQAEEGQQRQRGGHGQRNKNARRGAEPSTEAAVVSIENRSRSRRSTH